MLATRLADLADEVNVDLPLLSFDVSKLTDFQAAFETKFSRFQQRRFHRPRSWSTSSVRSFQASP